METFISTIAYPEDFKTFGRTGWGCGYVHIPKHHPILVQTIGNNGWGDYLQPDNCPEEITFSRWDENEEYFVIGFDTAHGYNDDSHDEVYVTQQAEAIKSLVDAYTFEDAKEYATTMIEQCKTKFSAYL